MPERTTDSRRASFAGSTSARQKRSAGATDARRTPANIRTFGVQDDPSLRRYVRDRLGRKLGKFAQRIERASVRFKDVNGPRGGIDTVCRIKVVISGLDSVVVEDRGARPRDAFDRAADDVERATRRSLGRARDLPRVRARRATLASRGRGNLSAPRRARAEA